MASTVKELLWTSYIMGELHLLISLPIPLLCDNQSTLLIAFDPCLHGCTKYIDIDIHFVCDHDKFGFMQPLDIPSTK